MKPTEELLRSKGQSNDKLSLFQEVYYESNQNNSTQIKETCVWK